MPCELSQDVNACSSRLSLRVIKGLVPVERHRLNGETLGGSPRWDVGGNHVLHV
jgi:hypothetical protein